MSLPCPWARVVEWGHHSASCNTLWVKHRLHRQSDSLIWELERFVYTSSCRCKQLAAGANSSTVAIPWTDEAMPTKALLLPEELTPQQSSWQCCNSHSRVAPFFSPHSFLHFHLNTDKGKKQRNAENRCQDKVMCVLLAGQHLLI